MPSRSGGGAGAAENARSGETADAVPGEAPAGAASDEGGEAGEGLSEAEAEIAAQRELRERIERRKAEREAPIASGAKLSGKAADLLAAVRAVESGEKPAADAFASPAPEPRRAAPAAPTARPVPRKPAEPGEAAVAAVRSLLVKGGAPEGLAGQAAEVLGEAAGDVLAEDPWRLLSVPGVRPEQADGFARALLGPDAGPGDERRTSALVTWLLERAALMGHTALEAPAVRAALAERSVPDPDGAVQQAVADGTVLVFQDGVDEDGGEEDDESRTVPVLLGLDRYAMAEESLADGLARLVRTGPADVWEGPELVRAAGAHGLVVHTGGEASRAEPVALAETARRLGLRAVVAVHAENGVRRLGPDAAAVTVAALLDGTAGPGRDEDGAFALDLLVVLDAPQLDVETAAMLVESMPDGGRLVLAGDPGVLSGAGAGRVFQDLLAARVCPQVASRTPDPGPLGELVSGIGIGELNQVAAPGREIVIVPVRDAGEAVHRTVQLVVDSVPRAIGVPAEQTQVITVGHGGSAGTRELNAALKQRLNPGGGRFAGFDPGDRVAYAPAPGRTLTGTVVSADAAGLHLDCEGIATVVPRERVESALRHGWALTAHQAEGMRWPAVVVVLPGDAAQALSRPWVYTAFGRAERHLSVVHGVDQALPQAVAERPGPGRTTRLRTLLEGLLAEPAAQPQPQPQPQAPSQARQAL
ncbi:helix-hairpin-helix domain-containing protein [Streptomyces peucetius]|uniref:ATP-binding domain-containing protein n=1 Tax=Streptomyces peucetius TaxID=1950 RepID=A0ABY6IHD0_STRPE|nr:helix-hairpin-helix domain-containing protein [Streptomyces peucetius]UYQ66418.1 ATP-binding domain-containing protein [Streptomyces peucetius]